MDNSIAQPQAKRLIDYTPYGFDIKSVNLDFELSPEKTKVTSILEVSRTDKNKDRLVLDGINLELISLKVNGELSTSHELSEESLSIPFKRDTAILEIITRCNPEQNKSLEGLYFAANAFCTQCEAEGFRKITYYPDRPDVLSTFTVKMSADKQLYPYLLSNGNKVDAGDTDDGRHWVKWHDPYKKPCYLFALVAGDFELVTKQFTTHSGRTVELQLFVDKGNGHRGDHALASLQKSMQWDEETFGLEYDLDIYMIVAVDFFNMGAMENKGLNVFNSKYVLADKDSATDEDYFNIESIVAHEYFHNWTGNRVTCRDWFQLSLKEGLTVFRDQEFSSDMSSPVLNRVKQVKVMREHQFPEDAGPMSHPIRPAEVIEMNNFYTVTVYDKGAEVIRMMHTLLGTDGFRKGMDLYFERHDGQAVTCDDFVQAMQDASGIDLSMFRRWYSQSGTPVVQVTQKYNVKQQSLTLEFAQSHPETADQKNKQNLHIPIGWEIVSNSAEHKKSGVFSLKETTESLTIDGVSEEPTVALLTNFSAPVKTHFAVSFKQALQTMLVANDGFSRWDAAQSVYSEMIWNVSNQQGAALESALGEASEAIHEIVDGLMLSNVSDLGLLAELLTLPGVDSLSEQVAEYDILALYDARKTVQGMIADNLQHHIDKYHEWQTPCYRYNTEDVARRRIKNTLLQYWTQATGDAELALAQFTGANNMTDKLGALSALETDKTLASFDAKMTVFEQQWRDDVLVLDKWFSLNARVNRKDILARLALLTAHQSFNMDNPNRVRSVVGTFAFFNTPQFHNSDGSGYRYVADQIIQLNQVNPQVAARIITPFLKWRKHTPTRQEQMQTQLLRIADTPDLSKDLFEKVSKSLSQKS